MIPYKNVNSFDEVKEAYPRYFDIQFLKRKEVIQFQKDELKELQKYWGSYKKIAELKEIASARAIYRFLWSIDHITVQMISCGWKPVDILILIERMKKAGYDPYSKNEDTVGEYLYSLRGHGFIEIIRPDGTTFLAYDPKGFKKPRKVKTATDYEEEITMGGPRTFTFIGARR